MKKIISILLFLILTLSLFACGGGGGDGDRCDECVDNNLDGKCDACGEEIQE